MKKLFLPLFLAVFAAGIVAAGAVLIINGYRLTADDGTLYLFVMGVAAGEIEEAGAAAFFRDHIESVEA